MFEAHQYSLRECDPPESCPACGIPRVALLNGEGTQEQQWRELAIRLQQREQDIFTELRRARAAVWIAHLIIMGNRSEK